MRGETEFYEMTSIGFRAGYGSIFGDGNHVARHTGCMAAHKGRRNGQSARDRSTGEARADHRGGVRQPGRLQCRRMGHSLDREACPALGGKTPNEFMGTEDGRALIENLISRMQSGAYS